MVQIALRNGEMLQAINCSKSTEMFGAMDGSNSTVMSRAMSSTNRSELLKALDMNVTAMLKAINSSKNTETFRAFKGSNSTEMWGAMDGSNSPEMWGAMDGSNNTAMFGAFDGLNNTNLLGLLNISNSTWQTDPLRDQAVSVSDLGPMLAFQLTVMAVILVGNVLVLVAVLRRKDLQTPSNIYLFNLALTDLMVGLSSLVKASSTLWPDRLNTPFICSVLRMGGTGFTMLLSLFLMTGIAVDRYLAVKLFRYNDFITVRRTVCAVCFMWLHCFAIGVLPPLLGNHNWTPDTPCFFIVITNRYILYYIYIAVFIAAITIVAVYVSLFRVASKHMRAIAALAIGPQAPPNFQAQLRSAKTVLLITGTFGVCWLPGIVNGLYLLQAEDPVEVVASTQSVQNFLVALMFLNCGMNPIIYAYRVPCFRIEFF